MTAVRARAAARRWLQAGLCASLAACTTEPTNEGSETCAQRGVVCTYLGTGEPGFNGDGLPLAESMVYWPVDLTFTESGERYLLDWNNHRVRELVDDTLETVIGSDFPGDGPEDLSDRTAEGAVGTDVYLNHPTQLLPRPDGSLVLLAWHNHKLRSYQPATGRVRVLGGGPAGYGGDGGPLGGALLNQPVHAAALPDGGYVIVDQRNQVIRRVSADGMIDTLAGTPMMIGYAGDGGPAREALFHQPGGSNPPPGGGIAVDDEGVVYVADALNHCIRRIDPDADVITTLAGNGEPGFSGDGGPAVDAQLDTPRKLTIGPDGKLYVGDSLNNRIRVIDLESGEIDTAVGSGEQGFDGDGRAPVDTALDRPAGVAFDDEGTLYVLDTYNNRVRRVLGYLEEAR